MYLLADCILLYEINTMQLTITKAIDLLTFLKPSSGRNPRNPRIIRMFLPLLVTNGSPIVPE